MNIRQRITLLVVLTFVAISSIGGYAIMRSRSSESEVRSVTEGVVPSALASADLVSQLKDVQLATVALVSAPNANLAAQAKESLTSRKSKLQDGLTLQLKQATGVAQTGLVEQATESLANYFSAIDDTAALKLAGQTALAEANLSATVGEYLKEIESIVDTLRVEKNRSKDSAIETLNASLSATVAIISAVTLIAVVAIAGIGMLLYRQIVIPISGMQAMMSEIASSQDFTRRVPVGREDEIGRSTMAFNTMIAKIQENSSLLKQKTTDIQTMLQNMPQGILTVDKGNKVHPEYSAYLETILETGDIAGRDMMDLVFADTNLGPDMLAQIEAACGACIGEDAMNFDFNEHLLVGEIEKKMADGRVRILDLNWSPIIDEDNTTVRLLLCVRDVTELRKLAAEANDQRRELEMIGEILAVSQEKFFQFIDSATKLIDSNEQIIHAHPTIKDADAITHLFRNMHTIKGNARTYALRHLTNTVHEAEQTYDDLRKPYPDIAWDQASLLEELSAVRELVARYARINEVSLGRKGPGRRGNVDRYLLVDRKQIDESLHRLETVNTGNLHELLAARDSVRKVLRLLGTESIAETLAGVFDSLPSLAMELDKVPPMIEIEDNGYVVRNQASGMIKNVFTHLIRNSMDHGIEIPEERLEQGKPAAGTIHLELDVSDGEFLISLADDGRGLAMSRIRAMVIDKGFVAADDTLSDEEIANHIFRPGFSTAEKVTEISGRGVGMDAALNFIKRENGKVEIRFLDDSVGASFRRFETVVTLPEAHVVHVDDSHRLAATESGLELLQDQSEMLQESDDLREIA